MQSSTRTTIKNSPDSAATSTSLSLFTRLKRLGPGFVYALTVLGTGDLVSNSAAGAGYGYSLIWAVALTLVFRFAWINVSAKYVLVTGESLIQGYARLGRWVVWLILVGVRGEAQVSIKHCNFLINLGGATAADFEGLGEEVRRRVFDVTGTKLEWEIKRVGIHENGDFGEVGL